MDKDLITNYNHTITINERISECFGINQENISVNVER